MKKLLATLKDYRRNRLVPADWRNSAKMKSPTLRDGMHEKIAETLKTIILAAEWAAFIDAEGVAHQLDSAGLMIAAPCREDNSDDGLLGAIHVQDRVEFLSTLSSCEHHRLKQNCQVRLKDRTFGGSTEFSLHTMDFQPWSLAAGEAEIYGVLIIGRNMESFHSTQKMLEERSDAFEQADIAKTRFLANMSHELRTPLNSIIGFSEVLKSGVMGELKPEKQTEYVGIINESAQHLLSVLNDILNISKLDAGKYQIFTEPFDFSNLLASAISMFEVAAADKDITLSIGLCDDLPEVTADSRAIKQVLINLLSNAIKFTPEGGAVSVSVERTGRKVSVTIEDTGIGISASQIEYLGKPFYQADSEYCRNYDGTGLGLSIVEGLLGLHGGSMDFESEVGRGTKVHVQLPINCSSQSQVPADCDAQVIKLNPLRKIFETEQDLFEETG